jgi:hypothetical protein
MLSMNISLDFHQTSFYSILCRNNTSGFIGAREASAVIINYSKTDRVSSHDSSLKYPLSTQVFKNSACD